MAAQGSQPVSAQNLAAALGAERSGGIGSQPVSVDNLKAALSEMGSGKVLYSGTPTQSVTLSDEPGNYDGIAIVCLYSNDYILIAASNTEISGQPFLSPGIEFTMFGGWSYQSAYNPERHTFIYENRQLTSQTVWTRIAAVFGINFTT